jgi:hypothetical protein
LAAIGGTPSQVAGAERSSVEVEIGDLEGMSLDELRLQWRNRWGRLAPTHIPRALLFRLIVYRLQAEAFGDLDPKSARFLDRLGDKLYSGSSRRDENVMGESDRVRKPGRPTSIVEPPSLVPKPGSVLTREWRGRVERVIALDKGYAWNGATYASLWAVAFAITGVKWSGRRFFFGRAARSVAGAEHVRALPA